MRKLIFSFLGLALLYAGLSFGSVTPAAAQTVNLWCYTGSAAPQWAPCSAANPLSITGSFSATTTGFPGSSQTTGTPISVTTGGVTGTLPAGAVVVASNVGATNGAYCKLGGSATTSDQLIPPNSWFAFTVGTNTQLTCITSTSTTTVNMVGGAGLPTGSGGGGGGGGSSGAVFGPTAAGSAAANPPVLLGGTIDGTATGAVDNAKVAGGLLFTQTALNAETTKVIGTVNQGTSPWVDSISTWAGGTLGAMANYGTSPGAVLVPGVNAAITNTPTVTANAGTNLNTSALATSANQGTNTATTAHTCSTGGFSELGCLGQIDDDIKTGAGATGSAAPSTAIYPGNNVGGNLTGQIGCGSSIVYDASTNGATQLVALSSGKVIYVCGYTILASGTVNVELDYGTGTNCGTGNNKITPAYQLTAQVGAVDGSPIYRGLATIASNELCIKTSAGVAVQAIVYYTQF